ncbi:ERCC4 domain-containing protein [Lasiosphaeria miniovina]|uniref:ERCC4 domain-containing protein n=1 Tax=Lasiosphaeria miniovina TaxID=1954250 RepID=A0AA39ZZH4_9PEZI|nr:ERCC4 domain-containing protein [Lasiosphaeria miniovina]KAK0706516.1 ERCC4 domain-containing protein [Lasiosphaeria miniovina]
MPIEIISLLSSPVVEPPPPAAEDLRRQPPTKPTLPAGKLDYGDDALDLTGDTLRRPIRRRIDAVPSLSRSRLPAAPDSLLLSDDFDFPSYIGRSDDDLLNSPAPKRQRLSGINRGIARVENPSSQSTTSAATFARPGRSKTLQRAGLGRSRPALEEVLLSSSQPLPQQQLSTKTAQSKSADFDDDPFAISSSQEKENNPRSVIATVTDDEFDPFSLSSPPRNKEPRPRQSPKSAVAWDPISSSAPLPAQADNGKPLNASHPLRRVHSEVIALDDSDDDVGRSSSSEDEFPDIGNLSAVPRTADEKARQIKEKAAAREAAQERKRLEKEQKVLEKERAAALAEVNKIRTDKKISTPEMIVDLPSTLSPTIKLQAETLLKDLDVEVASWNSPVENVIKWRRKVRARYSDELSHWEPVPLQIKSETYAMVIITADQFVQLVLGGIDGSGPDSMSLESHVLQMQARFPNQTIIYLIEGLAVWQRKNRNVRNRQYLSAVRGGLENDASATSGLPPPSTQNPRRRKNNVPDSYIDEDTVEDALLQLQVMHGVLIHHTTAAVATAQWIAVFTQHISTVPYRKQREESNDASAGFCMESGQVRTGDGVRDTYVRMLQEVSRVTAPIAYGLANEFSSVSLLLRGLEEGGPLTLEGIRRSANKDGALSDRAVGPALSRRLHKIFTSTDELSTDV